MVDYSRYLVDPWLGQKQAMATMQDTFNRQTEQTRYADQTELAKRGMAINELNASTGQGNLALRQDENRRTAETFGMAKEDRAAALRKKQAETLYDIMSQVNDDSSLQQAKQIMQGMASSGMIRQEDVDSVPDKFDKKRHADGLKMLERVVGGKEWEAFTGPGDSRLLRNIRTGDEKSVVGRQGSGSERGDYFTPVQTSSGVQILNSRKGTVEPMIGLDGKPVLPVAADVGLAGAKTTAEAEAKTVEEKRKSFGAVQSAYKAQFDEWDNLDIIIDEAIDNVSPFTTGVGAWTKVIPATTSKTLSEQLETIKANVGFNQLSKMRKASPTGGALGQVSEMENKLLQAVQGSMDQSLSAKELAKNLRRIQVLLNNLRTETDTAFRYDYKGLLGGGVSQTQIGGYKASEYKGRVLTNESGVKMRSDGNTWTRVTE